MGPVSLRQGLAHFGDVVRWNEWYASKLPWYLVGLSYAALSRGPLAPVHLTDMVVLLALFCLYASFGHMVNDYSDLGADRVAGKRKVLASWSRSAEWTALTVTAGTALVAAATFDGPTLALTGLAVVLAAAYSLPPARLKEREVLGWVAASMAQRTLPLAIVFQALGAWDWTAGVLCVLGTLIGLRFMIVHQILDRHNDLHAGVCTMATANGAEPLVALVARVLFPLEAATACVAVLAMTASLPAVAVVATGYVGWLVMRHRRGKRWSLVSYAPFNPFYSVLLPVLLAGLLAMRDSHYLPVLALAVALHHHKVATRVRRLAASVRAPRHDAEQTRNKPNLYPV